MPLLGVAFGGAALAVLVTLGSIFDAFREVGPAWWRELWHCPLCFGWWTGAAGAALFGSFQGVPFLQAAWVIASTGALSGCFALLFRRATDCLDGNTPP